MEAFSLDVKMSTAQVKDRTELGTRQAELHADTSSLGEHATLRMQGVLWQCKLREMCLVALWLPLGALLVCLVSACIFQYADIHETHCRVYNVVPSISAITGISPQRYLWRVCVAFHLGPRLLIGSLYHSLHRSRSARIRDYKTRSRALQVSEVCYWLNLVELCALTGVTYVSNRENYFVHEKIFIMFMVSSLLHMLCRAWVGGVDGCHGNGSNGVAPLPSNRTAWNLFWTAIASTVGLIFFFLRHRLQCRPLAFTWFSTCEYILASANMAFHALAMKDLPTHRLQVLDDEKRD